MFDANGDAVPDTRVIVSGRSARLEGVVDAGTRTVDELEESDDDLEEYQAVLNFDGHQSLREDRDIGTIELDVLPPSGSRYIDEQPTPKVRVVRN